MPASGTTDQGFVSRERARTIALLEGQVERTDHATQLFSEDLCERSGRRRAGDPDRRGWRGAIMKIERYKFQQGAAKLPGC